MLIRILEWTNPGFNRYIFILEDHGEKLIYDPDLGWKNAPGWSIERPNMVVSVNSHGLRGPERDYVKQNGVRRILILGDSFTFGYGVSDDETYPAVLEQMLRENREGYEILNMGVNGYGTDQQYLTLIQEGDCYAPDLVVLALFTGNDFFDVQSAALSYSAKPYFVDESLRVNNVPVPLYAGNDRQQAYFQPAGLIRFSALYRLLFLSAAKNYSAASFLAMFGLCGRTEVLKSNDKINPVDVAVAIIRHIADDMEQRKCPFVVMKFGDFLELNTSQVSSEFESKVQQIPGIHYLDLDDAFAARRLSKKTLTEGTGDYHWNNVGHRHVATILSEFLQQERLLSARPTTKR